MVDPVDAILEEEVEGAFFDIGEAVVGSREPQENSQPTLTDSLCCRRSQESLLDEVEVDVLWGPEHIRVRDLEQTGS